MNAMSARLAAGSRARRRRRARPAYHYGQSLLTVALSAAMVHAAPTDAATGILPLGAGAVQNGLAGAGTAGASDAFSAVRNPAAAAMLRTQLALGLDLAFPNGGVAADESTSRIGIFGFAPQAQGSVDGVLAAPQFAYNQRLGNAAWGVSLTAAGLSAEAKRGNAVFAGSVPLVEAQCQGLLGGGAPLPGTRDRYGLCGNGRSALQLQMYQLFLAAHYARALAHGLSLGLAPVVAVQLVDASGFQALANFSNEPRATSDNGADLSWGVGGRAGLLWQLADIFSVGAAWQSRIRMSESEDYAGLLPGGSLDIPSSAHVGIAVVPQPGHRLLADAEHIRYEDSRPLSNPVDAQRLSEDCLLPRLVGIVTPGSPAPAVSPACFGAAAGPGLGWRNLTVYKLGYEYSHGRLSLRMGYAQSQRPMGADQALAAMVAPATSRRHIAAGLSWSGSGPWRIDAMVQRALPERVEGPNPLSQVQLQLLPPDIDAGADATDQTVRAELDIWQIGLSLSRTLGREHAR